MLLRWLVAAEVQVVVAEQAVALGQGNHRLRAADLAAADAQRRHWKEGRSFRVRAATLGHQPSSTPAVALHFPEVRSSLGQVAVEARKYSPLLPVDPVVSRSSTSQLALTDDFEIRTGRRLTLL